MEAIEDVTSLRVSEGDQPAETFEVCCTEPPEPVTDLRIEKIVNGHVRRRTWTAVLYADDFFLLTPSAGCFSAR